MQDLCIAQQAWRSSRSQLLSSYVMDCGVPTVCLVPLWGQGLGETGLAFVSPALTTESDPPAILLHHFLSLATAQFSRKTEKDNYPGGL